MTLFSEDLCFSVKPRPSDLDNEYLDEEASGAVLCVLVPFSNCSLETGSLKAGVTPPNSHRVSAPDIKQRCPSAGSARFPGGQTESESPGEGLGMGFRGHHRVWVVAKFKTLRMSVKHSGQYLVRVLLRLSQH